MSYKSFLRLPTIQSVEAPAKRLVQFILLLMLSTSAQNARAQLAVLSNGNTTEKWRQAQLETLSDQLTNGQANGPLKRELESQREWLSKWQPGELSKAPMWSRATAKGRFTEPILDPNKRATKLRETLLAKNAKPTVKDTKRLERLLAQFSGDIGVRQLHLHWLDQRHYRKQYADEIADAALRLSGLLEQVKPQTQETKVARAFCLYRRGRALAYRELPDVVAENPIKDQGKHTGKLVGTFSELIAMVGSGRPEFILLEIRMLRRDHWYGQALALLESNGRLIERQWFLKKRRDLLKELGWQEPYEEAADIYEANFPNEVTAEKSDA